LRTQEEKTPCERLEDWFILIRALEEGLDPDVMLAAWEEGHNYAHTSCKVSQSHYRPQVPRGFQEIQVPRLRDKVVKPYAPAAFTRRKYSWYSFLLERKDYVNEKFQ
jgi:hypothetical protein